jgi:hypothetical protein
MIKTPCIRSQYSGFSIVLYGAQLDKLSPDHRRVYDFAEEAIYSPNFTVSDVRAHMEMRV